MPVKIWEITWVVKRPNRTQVAISKEYSLPEAKAILDELREGKKVKASPITGWLLEHALREFEASYKREGYILRSVKVIDKRDGLKPSKAGF